MKHPFMVPGLAGPLSGQTVGTMNPSAVTSLDGGYVPGVSLMLASLQPKNGLYNLHFTGNATEAQGDQIHSYTVT